VSWLIHTEPAATRERQLDDKSPWLHVNRGTRDTVMPHLLRKLFDVFTHQIELVAPIRLRGMKGDLGWRQTEYEPSTANIDRREPQHVSEECAIGLGVRRI
jgi:hypothetical protein